MRNGVGRIISSCELPSELFHRSNQLCKLRQSFWDMWRLSTWTVQFCAQLLGGIWFLFGSTDLQCFCFERKLSGRSLQRHRKAAVLPSDVLSHSSIVSPNSNPLHCSNIKPPNCTSLTLSPTSCCQQSFRLWLLQIVLLLITLSANVLLMVRQQRELPRELFDCT